MKNQNKKQKLNIISDSSEHLSQKKGSDDFDNLVLSIHSELLHKRSIAKNANKECAKNVTESNFDNTGFDLFDQNLSTLAEEDQVNSSEKQITEKASKLESIVFDEKRFDKFLRLIKKEPHAFYAHAEFMKDFIDNYENYVEFCEYFPTYNKMSIEQLRTYFSWRTKVRQGAVENVSVSYAFCYIYELINNIAVINPTKGIEQLISFWNDFRLHDNTIDKYMKRWIDDYFAVNNNEFTKGYEFYYDQFPNDVKIDFEDKKPWDAIKKIEYWSSYNITKTGYYNHGDSKKIDYYICQVFEELAKKLQKDNFVLQTVFYDTETISYTPFFNTPCVIKKMKKCSVKFNEFESMEIHNNQAFLTRICTDYSSLIIGYILKLTQFELQTRMFNRISIKHPNKSKGLELNTLHNALIRKLTHNRNRLDNEFQKNRMKNNKMIFDLLKSTKIEAYIKDILDDIYRKNIKTKQTLGKDTSYSVMQNNTKIQTTIPQKVGSNSYDILKKLIKSKSMQPLYKGFPEQAKFMEKFDEESHEYVKLQGYAGYTTYKHMNDDQLRTYFSWRTKVRNGDVENVSLAYAFCYINELINDVGVKNANETMEQLFFFWLHFREHNSKIDDEIKRVIIDYYVVNHSHLIKPFTFYSSKFPDTIKLDYKELNPPWKNLEKIERSSLFKFTETTYYLRNNSKSIDKKISSIFDYLEVKLLEKNIELGNLFFNVEKSNYLLFENFVHPKEKVVDYTLQINEFESIEIINNTCFKTAIKYNQYNLVIGYLLQLIHYYLQCISQGKPTAKHPNQTVKFSIKNIEKVLLSESDNKSNINTGDTFQIKTDWQVTLLEIIKSSEIDLLVKHIIKKIFLTKKEYVSEETNHQSVVKLSDIDYYKQQLMNKTTPEVPKFDKEKIKDNYTSVPESPIKTDMESRYLSFSQEVQDNKHLVSEFNGYSKLNGQSSFTTYSDMNQRQLDTYFSWRKRVRRGVVDNVSTAYAFCYINEIINDTKTKKSSEVLEELITFWNNFRVYDNSIDMIYEKIINDFYVANHIEIRNPYSFYFDKFPFEIWNSKNKIDEPWKSIEKLESFSDYKVTNREYYKRTNFEENLKCIFHTFKELNDEFQKKGIEFINLFYKPLTKEYSLFDSVLYKNVKLHDCIIIFNKLENIKIENGNCLLNTFETSPYPKLVGYILQLVVSESMKCSNKIATLTHPIKTADFDINMIKDELLSGVESANSTPNAKLKKQWQITVIQDIISFELDNLISSIVYKFYQEAQLPEAEPADSKIDYKTNSITSIAESCVKTNKDNDFKIEIDVIGNENQYRKLISLGNNNLQLSRYEQFIMQARFMQNYTEKEYNYVPLFSEKYTIIYTDMTINQLKTYFSWRTKVRQGHVDNVSISYAFCYINELINIIGPKTHSDVMEQLISFWKKFRIHNASIDNYINQIIEDYFFVNYNKIIKPYSFYSSKFPNKNLQFDYITLKPWESLKILEDFSMYKVSETDYYKISDTKKISNCICYTFDELNKELFKLGINFESFFYENKNVERKLLYDALYKEIKVKDLTIELNRIEKMYTIKGICYRDRITNNYGQVLIGYILKIVLLEFRKQERKRFYMIHPNKTTEMNIDAIKRELFGSIQLNSDFKEIKNLKSEESSKIKLINFIETTEIDTLIRIIVREFSMKYEHEHKSSTIKPIKPTINAANNFDKDLNLKQKNTQNITSKLHIKYQEFQEIINSKIITTLEKDFLMHAKIMEWFEDDYEYKMELFGRGTRTTYKGMSFLQLRTYFSWRTKVRQGIVENVSPAYAFCYINEIINDIGINNKEEGLEKIISLWKGFRKYHKSIDEDFERIIIDYFVVNVKELKSTYRYYYNKFPINNKSYLYDGTKVWDNLLRIEQSSAYSVTKTQYYRRQVSPKLSENICSIFKDVDKYFDNLGVNFKNLFIDTKTNKHTIYENLLHQQKQFENLVVYINSFEKIEINKNVCLKTEIKNDSYPATIGYILKSIFIALRKHTSKTVDMVHPRETKELKLAYIKQELIINKNKELNTNAWKTILLELFESSKIDKIIESIVYNFCKRKNILHVDFEFYNDEHLVLNNDTIKIDMSKLDKIRKDQVEVANKLNVEDFDDLPANGLEESIQTIIKPIEYNIHLDNANFTTSEVDFIKCLIENYSTIEINDILATTNLDLEVMVENINEKFLEIIGDIIIDITNGTPVLYEEYTNEILENL